jgi:hypothetical protein
VGSVLVSTPSLLDVLILSFIAFASAVSWDKQLAAICGRPPLMRLYDFDVSLPTTTDSSGSEDHVLTIFNQFILLNALLEKTLAASIQRPVFDNSDLLTRLSEESNVMRSRDDALPAVERSLQKWSECVFLQSVPNQH